MNEEMQRRGRSVAFGSGLAAIGVSTLLMGWFVLAPAIVFDGRRGDWRAASEGLRRSQDRLSLAAGERAVVHFHDLRRTPAEVRVSASLRAAAAPTRLVAESGGRVVFAHSLSSRPIEFSVPVPPGARDVDIFMTAEGGADSPAPLYRIESITLVRQGALFRVGQALPAGVALVTFLVMWARGRRASALGWSLLAAALVAWLWIVSLDPESALRVRPATREACLAAALACLWALALAGAAPRGEAVVALLGTVMLLYGSSLHYGFAADDYLWARPWSVKELFSTLAGPEDPHGIALGKYRPLPSWTRAADYLLWGVDGRGWHLTNLVLHSLNGLLGLAVLGRLGLAPRAALAGTLVFLAHPLSASTAAWATQRTDGLLVLFYLGALFAGLRATLQPSDFAVVGVAMLLALMSKETAVTLPIVTSLARRCLLREPHPHTRWLLVLGGALVVAYAAFWASLFSGQVAFRPRALPSGVSGGMRLIGGLFAPVFLPTGYQEWYDRRLQDWPMPYLMAAVVVAVAPWALIAACGRCRSQARLAPLALVWPVVVVAPMLGVRIVDLYRLGLLLCFPFALTWGVLMAHAEHKAAWLPSALTLALSLWLTPLAARTAAAWAPAGFQASRSLELDRQNPDWLAALGAEAKALFWEQVERRDHARAFLGR